jgi:hypothetical protein
MTTVRTLFAIGSIVISSAVGCGEPGIVEVNRVMAGDGGTAADVADSAAGDGGSPDLGPCPSGYNCMDLSSLGATATDQDGKPVTHSCSNGALAACDDANPAASCTQLTAPICAHVRVSGMDFVSCGQRCGP